MANDTINHGASIAQEAGIVVKIKGITRGPGIVDNWTGNNVVVGGAHLLDDSGNVLTDDSGNRLTPG